MGSVGLSFGSPTSGAGFDVSSTVAQIVSNLQNVETPWKTQLTALQSQDTALSNLGSLFSKLSTDLSSLTDFTGVLAQKTGASSNTSVLQLTSATTSAQAGTHTVVINTMAQTSSGYVDPVSSASDTLGGTFSVTMNGATKSFDLSTLSKPTLAGLASAINSSGLGVTASILTDSQGSRLSVVSGKSGQAGQMTVTSALTDATMVTTTNATGSLSYHPMVAGKDASLDVDGVPLSSASNIVTNLIPGVTFQMLSPSSLDSNGNPIGVQVVIGNDNTDVETAVNSLVTDYNSLISAINAQQGSDSSGKPEPLYGSPTLSLLQQRLLGAVNTQNPNGYLEAIKNSADTLTGSITIQVGTGTAQTIQLPDAGGTLGSLADAINSANIGVTASILTDSTGSHLALVSQTAGAIGALTVTSAVSDSTTGTSLAYNSGGSDVSGLASLGISMNNDGSLKLDASTLDAVLNSDFAGVTAFFQNANSWGMTFSHILNSLGSDSASGVLKLAESANSSTETNLNTDISKEEAYIATQQKNLTAELNTANQILQELPTQLESTNMLYSAITGYNQNSNG